MTGTYPLNSQGHEEVPMGQPSQLPNGTQESQSQSEDVDDNVGDLTLGETEDEEIEVETDAARALREAQEDYGYRMQAERQRRALVDASWERLERPPHDITGWQYQRRDQAETLYNQQLRTQEIVNRPFNPHQAPYPPVAGLPPLPPGGGAPRLPPPSVARGSRGRGTTRGRGRGGGRGRSTPPPNAVEQGYYRPEDYAATGKFSDEEALFICQLAMEIVPIGTDLWDQLTTRYNQRYPYATRLRDNIRKKFNSMAAKKEPTGNPYMPEHIELAKKAMEKIKTDSNMTTGSSDEEDVDIYGRPDDTEEDQLRDEEQEGSPPAEGAARASPALAAEIRQQLGSPNTATPRRAAPTSVVTRTPGARAPAPSSVSTNSSTARGGTSYQRPTLRNARAEISAFMQQAAGKEEARKAEREDRIAKERKREKRRHRLERERLQQDRVDRERDRQMYLQMAQTAAVGIAVAISSAVAGVTGAPTDTAAMATAIASAMPVHPSPASVVAASAPGNSSSQGSDADTESTSDSDSDETLSSVDSRDSPPTKRKKIARSKKKKSKSRKKNSSRR